MDPKQTSPLGAPQVGGQEGQPVQPTPAVGDVSGANSPAATPAAPISPAPVFSTGTEQPATSTPQKMAGDLGAESLSTGANVSHTMDNLNDANQSATGAPIFAKHKFDKIEYATGDILLNKDDPKPKRRFFGGSSAPRPKSAAEISREARREAKRLRKLNKAGGSAVEAIPTPAEPASTKPSLLSSKNFKLAIGAIVGVLVIVAGILGVVALSKDNSQKKKPTVVAVTDEMVREAFEDYSNWVLHGINSDVKDNDTENINDNLGINILQRLQGSADFILTSEEKFNTFKDLFEGSNFTENNHLQNSVIGHGNTLSFFVNLINIEPVSDDEIYEIYNNGGDDAAVAELLSDRYGILLDSGYIGEQYISALIAYGISKGHEFGLLKENGCITSSGGSMAVDETCALFIAGQNNDVNRALMEAQSTKSNTVTSLTMGIADMKQGLSNIKQQLLEPYDKSYVVSTVDNTTGEKYGSK